MAATRPWLPVASSSSSSAAATAAGAESSPSPPHEPDSPRLAHQPQPATTTRDDDDDDDDDNEETSWRNRGGIRLVGSYRGADVHEDRERSPIKANGTITNDKEKPSHLLPAQTPSISISSPPPRTGSTSSASPPPPPSPPTLTTAPGGYDDHDDDDDDDDGRECNSRRPSFSSSSSSVGIGTAASLNSSVDPRAAPAANGTVSQADRLTTAPSASTTTTSSSSRKRRNRFRSSKPKDQRKGQPPPPPPIAASPEAASSSSSDFLVSIGTNTNPVSTEHGETLPSPNTLDETFPKTRRSALEAEGGGMARLSSSSRSSSTTTTTTTSGSSSRSLKQSTTITRSHHGSSTMLGFSSTAAGSGSSDSSSLSLSPSASGPGSRSGPSTTTTAAVAGGGEGRLARGLRKTRSGLKLFAARAAAAAAAASSSSSSTSREQEPIVETDHSASAAGKVLPPRDATWQADSPPPPLEVPSHSEEAAATTQLDSSSSSGGRSRISLHSSTLGERGGNSALSSATQPRPASAPSRVTLVHPPPPPPPQSPPSGTRIGGWFNSLMPTTTTTTNNGAEPNPASSPVKARMSSAVTTGSPKRRGSGGSSSGPRPGLMGGGRPSSASSSSSSPLKKTSSSSAVTSTSTASGVGTTTTTTGRFGPFDRMLDRAVQYFLDTDSHADRCEDEIWLLGVRHAGWNPDAVEEAERAAASEAGGGSHEGGGGGKSDAGRRGGGLAGLVARRASPVKARKIQQQQQQASQPSPRPMAAAASTASGDDPFVNVSSSAGAASDPLAPAAGTDSAVGGPATTSSSSSATATATAARTRIHGWPATFYRDFYSRVGLTYRSDFPLIECDPAPQSGGAGGVVHGMLSNLSMSLGRGAQRLANVGAGAGENSGEEKMQAAVMRGLSSDTGWGCMLRTGQSLLANALVKVHLGRDWRRPLSNSPDAIPQAATYARILSLFLDDPSPLSPFSVHQFARQGKQLGKEIGEWFGPSTAAGAIKTLVNAYEPAGLRVVSCIDGTVYESEVVEASTVEGTSWKRPVLVLVNVRLGLEGVNPVYHDSIKSVFRFPQSVGIAGGRPISSYYFVGAQADSLFYIDPHFPRPAVPLVLPSDPELVEAFSHVPVRRVTGRIPSSSSAAPVDRDATRNGRDSSNNTADQIDHFLLSAYPDSVWASYHCDKVRKVSLSSLDPSMLIGFVVETDSDWLDFRNRVHELSQTSAPMFTVAPSPPAWLRRSASATTAVRTASGGGARNSLDDSFSVIGESRADNDDDDLDNDGFSEPEDWELQSTDDEGLRSSVLVERSTPPAQAATSRSPDDRVIL